jgi:hypothetical protein
MDKKNHNRAIVWRDFIKMTSPAFYITAINALSRSCHLFLYVLIGNIYGADDTTDVVFF